MNANLFHNIANVAQALIGLLVAVVAWIGCNVDAVTQSVDCSKVDPKYAIAAGAAVSAIAVLKVIVNIAKVGVAGLVKGDKQ